MKSQKLVKNISFIVIISVLLKSNAFAFGMGGGGEGFGPGCGSGGNIHLPQKLFSPSTIPNIKSHFNQPEVEVTQVVANYSVGLHATNQNTISCGDLTKKIKEQNILGLTENQITEKINNGSVLSSGEIKTLKNIQSSATDFQNLLLQDVNISVSWQFFGRMEYFNSLNNSGHASDFSKFSVKGSGLSWDASEGNERPDYFIVDIDRGIELEYKMSILDFCYGESEVTMTSKVNEDGTDGYVLKASWMRNLTQENQFGSWTVENLFDYEFKKR